MTSKRLPRALSVLVVGTAVAFASGFVSIAEAGDWTITPRVSGQEIFTDNVFYTPTNRRSDFITNVAPGIGIAGESGRIQAKLDYSPTLQFYARNPRENFIGHNLYANGTAIVIPDLFFFDARGYASLQPNSPALGTGITPSFQSTVGSSFTNLSQGIPKVLLSQVTSFSGSPYLLRRFDGFGTGELRYTVSNTSITSEVNGTSLNPPGFAVQNTPSLTNEATAAFVTGEEFGRFASRLLVDAAQSSGSGVNNANQKVAIADSAYAITRRIAALGTIGYEEIHFGGFPPTSIKDLVWGLGARLTPFPDAELVLKYGHRNGVTAPYASLVYNLTPRTNLSANYTEGITTVSQEIAGNLAISDLNPVGQTVDSRTLLPLQISNPVLGLQNGLFRMRQLTGTVRTDLERDRFTASAYRSENLLVAESTLGSGTSQRATGGYVTWSRELSPLTTVNVGVGYARLSFPALINTEERILTTSASLSYLFTQSLTGWMSYNFIHRTATQPELRLLANVVSVGIRKDF